MRCISGGAKTSNPRINPGAWLHASLTDTTIVISLESISSVHAG